MTMLLSNIVYIFAIAFAGVITTAMAFHLWINRKLFKPDLSFLLLFGLWIWILGQIGEVIFVELGIKILFYKIKFTGISVVSASWLGFCYQLISEKTGLKLPLFTLTIAPALGFNLLSFIPPFEKLSWKRFFISSNGLLLDIEPDVGYFIFNIYCIILIINAFLLLLFSLISKKSLIKIRLLPFALATIICLVAALADFFLKKELNFYRFLPLALSLSSLIVIYFIRLRYYRAIPLAQHLVVESLADAILIITADTTIVYFNPAAKELLQISPITIVGRKLEKYSPQLSQIITAADSSQQDGGLITLKERFYDLKLSAIFNRKKQIVYRIIALRDVTELKKTETMLRDLKDSLENQVTARTQELIDANQTLREEIAERQRAEALLRETLEEKNILLSELHHRVKNNLQIISSLLRLQSYSLNDSLAQELFDNSIARIRAIALVHEKLYRSQDLASIDISDHLRELVYSIISFHNITNEPIATNFDIASIALDMDQCILVGLIVNELVINSLKHAFKDFKNKEKKISISLKLQDEEICLIQADNGSGLPADTSSGLGMKIISTLVKQLKGHFDVKSHAGTEVSIFFPFRKHRSL